MVQDPMDDMGAHFYDWFDIDILEAHLADLLLGQTEEPPPVTRRTYHRHQSWRTGVTLHQKADCPQMTGRSDLKERTVEIGADSTENIQHLCWDCITTRPGRQRDMLSRAALREMIETYHSEGPEEAVGYARMLDRTAGTALEEDITAGRPLPVSREIMKRLTLTSSACAAEQQLDRLRRLIPNGQADGSIEEAAQLRTAGDRTSLGRQLQEWWSRLPATALENLEPATPRASEDAGESGPGEARGDSTEGRPAAAIRRLWEAQVTATMDEQARLRTGYMRDVQARSATVELLMLTARADRYMLGRYSLPAPLLVPAGTLRTSWGETVGVWRTYAAVADLAADDEDIAVVRASGTGSSPSEVSAAAVRILSGSMTLQEAAETAEGALYGTAGVG